MAGLIGEKADRIRVYGSSIATCTNGIGTAARA